MGDNEAPTAGSGDGDPAATLDGSSSLLEDVLDGVSSPSDIDGSANSIAMGGQMVCKASAYHIIFGKGTPKSNDRLKRVRGIGRAHTVLPSISEGAEDDESDMHGLVCPVGIVAVVAAVGDCEAVCLAIVEQLKSTDGVETELTLAELAQSGTKVVLRLAVVATDGGALRVSGRGVPFATATVEGVAVKPLTFSTTGEFGVTFDLAELRAFAAEFRPGAAGSRKFSAGSAQHADLVVEGTQGMAVAAALEAANAPCAICPLTF